MEDTMGDLSTNFSEWEFRCPCCKDLLINFAFIHTLQQARDMYGESITVNSGYRCKNRNREVGGEDDSAHPLGTGGDLKLPYFDKRSKFLIAMLTHFPRVGIYSEHVHVDLKPKDDDTKHGVWIEPY